MKQVKNALKYCATAFLVLLVSLCIYTFVITDVLKKDYVNVFGYTYFVVATGSMSGTIEVDDIIFVKITKEVQTNDVITFKNKDGDIITHRLITKNGGTYITKGDVNNVADEPIEKDQIIGRVSFVVSPSFILKSIAIFLIVFILLALVNFDSIIKKYILRDSDDRIEILDEEEVVVKPKTSKEKSLPAIDTKKLKDTFASVKGKVTKVISDKKPKKVEVKPKKVEKKVEKEIEKLDFEEENKVLIKQDSLEKKETIKEEKIDLPEKKEVKKEEKIESEEKKEIKKEEKAEEKTDSIAQKIEEKKVEVEPVEEKEEVVIPTIVNRLPEEIFKNPKNRYDEPSTGMTVTIALDDLETLEKLHEREMERDDRVEVLEEFDDYSFSYEPTKKKSQDKREKETIDFVVSILKVKNNDVAKARMNKKWLEKYQYVYRLCHLLLVDDPDGIEDDIEKPPFKEIYDYDLDKVGLTQSIRNRIYDMPLYVFLRILTYAILYNDDEMFDGVYKIMKYKSMIDRDNDFKRLHKYDKNAYKQVRTLISFMQKISNKFDNKHVFELDKIERLAKIRKY